MKKPELITPHVTARAHTRLLDTPSSALTYVSMHFCWPVRKDEIFNCLVPLLAPVQQYSPNEGAKYDPRYILTTCTDTAHNVPVSNMHTYGCVMLSACRADVLFPQNCLR
jgi:hypothetical protein